MDQKISTLIKSQNYNLWDLSINVVRGWEDIYELVSCSYLESNCKFFAPLTSHQQSPVPKIIYTPMHGVGGDIVEAQLKAFQYPPLICVPSQRDPNPDFPTVTFPNPEEGINTLKEAISHAQINGASLIFANDPDADRFNFSEFNKAIGEWKVFTGNEIATLFADFLWEKREWLYPKATKFAMVCSNVSSKLLLAMGNQKGFKVAQTPTGFKYLANKAQELQREGFTVLMAFEEAIGFMVNPSSVWDKDGISALCLAYFLTIESHNNGKSLREKLTGIYKEVGYFAQYNSYYYLQDPSKIPAIFSILRQRLHYMIPESRPDNLPSECQISIDCEATIHGISDPGGLMITLLLSMDRLSWLTIRGSGTEPKIKFYSEIKSKWEEREESQIKLQNWTRCICNWLLEPTINQMKLQSVP